MIDSDWPVEKTVDQEDIVNRGDRARHISDPHSKTRAQSVWVTRDRPVEKTVAQVDIVNRRVHARHISDLHSKTGAQPVGVNRDIDRQVDKTVGKIYWYIE